MLETLTRKIMRGLVTGNLIAGSFAPLPLSKHISDKPVVWKRIIKDEYKTLLQQTIFLNNTHLLIRRNEDSNNSDSQRCYLYIDANNDGTVDYCGVLDSQAGTSLSTVDFNLTPIESFPQSAARGFQKVYEMYNQIIHIQKEGEGK